MPRARRAPDPSPTNNRSDLLNPPQPISTVPGQGYGVARDQQEAQRVSPMAGGGTSLPSAPASSGPPAAPQGAPGPGDLASQASGFNGPGDSMLLGRPTERPNEPVTHGLPIGPGGGPEVLNGVGAAARQSAVETGTLTHLLSSLASLPNATSAIKDIAARAQTGAL